MIRPPRLPDFAGAVITAIRHAMVDGLAPLPCGRRHRVPGVVALWLTLRMRSSTAQSRAASWIVPLYSRLLSAVFCIRRSLTAPGRPAVPLRFLPCMRRCVSVRSLLRKMSGCHEDRRPALPNRSPDPDPGSRRTSCPQWPRVRPRPPVFPPVWPRRLPARDVVGKITSGTRLFAARRRAPSLLGALDRDRFQPPSPATPLCPGRTCELQNGYPTRVPEPGQRQPPALLAYTSRQSTARRLMLNTTWPPPPSSASTRPGTRGRPATP